MRLTLDPGTRGTTILSEPSVLNMIFSSRSESLTAETFVPFCNMSQAQLSFHGHRDAVKFFVAVPGGLPEKCRIGFLAEIFFLEFQSLWASCRHYFRPFNHCSCIWPPIKCERSSRPLYFLVILCLKLTFSCFGPNKF